jgi:hypothetical protein
LVCLRSFDILGTNKFVLLPPFDSWGTNIFVLIKKKFSKLHSAYVSISLPLLFFMFWSRGIDSKEPIPLANVAWARICKILRSPEIDSKEPIP